MSGAVPLFVEITAGSKPLSADGAALMTVDVSNRIATAMHVLKVVNFMV